MDQFEYVMVFVSIIVGPGIAHILLGSGGNPWQDLAGIKQSVRLAQEPVLQDYVCFKRFADDPFYQDLLRFQEHRRATSREQLPATLADFVVKLW